MNVFLDLKMNWAIEFRNRAINLDVLPEKAITGETLAIEIHFLKNFKIRYQRKKKLYLSEVMFTKKK